MDIALGDIIAAALPELRAQAESLMQDTCAVTVPGEGEGTYDESTQATIPPEPVTLYAGRCRVQISDPTANNPNVAGDLTTVSYHKVSLPWSAPTAPVGAMVIITASAHDPRNAGRRFAVRTDLRKTHATAYRLQCEELQ